MFRIPVFHHRGTTELDIKRLTFTPTRNQVHEQQLALKEQTFNGLILKNEKQKVQRTSNFFIEEHIRSITVTFLIDGWPQGTYRYIHYMKQFVFRN